MFLSNEQGRAKGVPPRPPGESKSGWSSRTSIPFCSVLPCLRGESVAFAVHRCAQEPKGRDAPRPPSSRECGDYGVPRTAHATSRGRCRVGRPRPRMRRDPPQADRRRTLHPGGEEDAPGSAAGGQAPHTTPGRTGTGVNQPPSLFFGPDSISGLRTRQTPDCGVETDCVPAYTEWSAVLGAN